jgi:hypothetical protein
MTFMETPSFAVQDPLLEGRYFTSTVTAQFDTVTVTSSIRSSADVVDDDVHPSLYRTVVPVTGGRSM